MTDTASLRISVDSKGVTITRAELDKLTSTGERTEKRVGTAMQRMNRRFDRLKSGVFSLQGAFAALGGALLARQITQSSTLYQQLEGRLKLVTGSAEELATVQESLFSISQRTYSSYESTVQLYSRVARSADQLGASQKQLAAFTETVNQAVQASGGSAQEAQSGIIQLSQALASSTLQGDELRSVLENMPRLARAIADGMGVTVGELRQLGSEGELQSQRVFEAILSQREKIASEFDSLPRRLDQALTQLRNDIDKAFSSTSTQPLIDAVDDFRNVITDPEIVSGLQDIAGAVLTVVSRMAQLLVTTKEITKFLGESAAANIEGGAIGDIPRLEDQIKTLEKLKETNGANIFRMGRFKNLGTNFGAYASDDEIDSALADLKERLRLSREMQSTGGGNVTQLPTVNVEAPALDMPGFGGGGGKQSDIDRRIQSLREQVALYGDLSRAEETRIALANGFYGQTTPAQEQRLMQLAREYDSKQRIQDMREQEIERVRELVRAEQKRKDIVSSLEQELMTDTERSSAALQRRLELIRQNVTDSQKALELTSRAMLRFREETEQNMGGISAFAEQAARNIQDQLGDTLSQTLRGDFDGILDSWSQMLIDMAAQAQAAQLNKMLFGNLGQGGGGDNGILGTALSTIGSAVGSYFGGPSSASVGQSFADAGIGGMSYGTPSGFGGAYASGGTMPANKWSLVGEQGPELVRPSTPTTVLPNGTQPQGGSANVVMHVQYNEAEGKSQDERRSDQENFARELKTQVQSAFVSDMSERGPMSRAMQGTFNLKRTGS